MLKTRYRRNTLKELKDIIEKISNTETPEVKTRVFVYGSLLKDLGNHICLDGQEFEGEAISVSKYTMVNLGGFPGVFERGETSIKGETYLVNSAGMIRLNRLEGINEKRPKLGMYRREDIELDDGSLAVVYIYNGKSDNIVENGDWKKNRRDNQRAGY